MDKLASEYKVLIVDDVPTNVMLVQAILKKEGYTLLTCDSGTKALRIANEKHPNLILLDIMMPEMDGYEVLQHLKSNPETTDIPVIIMSALSDMQSIVKGYQLGATEYVTKPFQREELVKRVAHRYELYSIKRIKDGNIAADVARNTLAAVQTPQVFRADLLRRAYEAEYRPEFTDDASVVEQAGEAVFLCEGERTNLKITTPEDMVIAEALLAGREKTEESADGENL